MSNELHPRATLNVLNSIVETIERGKVKWAQIGDHFVIAQGVDIYWPNNKPLIDWFLDGEPIDAKTLGEKLGVLDVNEDLPEPERDGQNMAQRLFHSAQPREALQLAQRTAIAVVARNGRDVYVFNDGSMLAVRNAEHSNESTATVATFVGIWSAADEADFQEVENLRMGRKNPTA